MSPIPGTGDCALGGHGPFCRLRRRRFRTLRRAGRAAARRQRQKGVQDTSGVLSPKIGVSLLSLRLSLFYNNYMEKSQMIF